MIEFLYSDMGFYYRLLIFFMFGSVLGSFFNVLIGRYDNGYTFNSLMTPSRCVSCQSKIKPWFNVPIIGYFLTLGKCYSCKSEISPKYPINEAFFAGMAAFITFTAPVWVLDIVLFVISSAVVIAIQIKYREK